MGSTIALPSRIRSYYIAKAESRALGDRPLESAIIKYGLGQFQLKIHIITPEILALIFPEGLASDIVSIKEYKLRIGVVVKVLEEILILRENPAFNELKIVGSTVGIVRSEYRKTTYLFDKKHHELIYISNSRAHLDEILQVSKVI